MSNNAGRIEITENTLLKLLVRRGSNTERSNIVLSEGELGYTVDTRRLFVGDGVTTGAYPTSLFLYFGTSHPSTWASAAEIGDVAYDSIAGGIYRLTAKPYSTSGNWSLFSGPLANRVDGETLQLNTSTGVMSVKTVSAAQLDPELAGLGLDYNGTRELQTTANQQFDAITTRNNAFINLPQAIQFGTQGGASIFNMPSFDGAQNTVFTTDGSGNITLADPKINTRFLILSSNIVPVGTIVQYGSGGNFNDSSSTIPYGYFVCNGSTKDGTVYSALCAAIGQYYGGTGTSFNVPQLTAANYVYLIKYLEDVVYQQSIVNLSNTLTGYNATNSLSVLSFVFPNSGIDYELGIKNLGIATEKLANASVTTEKLALTSVTTEKLALTSVSYEKIAAWPGMPLRTTFTQTSAVSTFADADVWIIIGALSAACMRVDVNSSIMRIQSMINLAGGDAALPVSIRAVRWTDANPAPVPFASATPAGTRIASTAAVPDSNSGYTIYTVPIDCYDVSVPSVSAVYYGLQIYNTSTTNCFMNRAVLDADNNNTLRTISTFTVTEIKS